MPPQPIAIVAGIQPYEWEAMPSEVAARAGIPESEIVHFDTNTASWPPVAWEQTVLDLPRLPANEYPHPSNEPLRTAVARRHGVAPDRVIVTAGADEALFLVAHAYLGPGRTGVVPDPSFAMFRVVTEVAGANVRRVALDTDWELPLESVVEAARDPAVGVVWLCSPNNPTGRLLSPALVQAVIDAAPHAVVAIDEAYAEISGVSVAECILASPNGVLIRTFSKGYGLAGARVGYLIGQLDVTRAIEKVRPPQNLTVFGISAACRALADHAGLEERVAVIVAERERLATELRLRGYEVVPSAGNFLLVRPPAPAAEVADWLQGGGLIGRSYPGHPRLNDWLRLTVRAPDEDDRLLRRLDAAG
jgi:histidinol-phosphate aminotransferase